MSGKAFAYNLTIPHSSGMVRYTDFLWACPPDAGGGSIVRCDGSSKEEAKAGWHYSNRDKDEFEVQIYFMASSIYLYGTVDEGIEYSSSVSGGGPEDGDKPVTGKPDGAILAKHEGLHGYVGPAMPQLLKLTAKRVSGSGTMNFTYAVATVDSQFREGGVKVTTYTVGEDDVKLTAGWKQNGSYWQADRSTKAQTLTFNWEGNAVLAYGQCTNTIPMSSSGGLYFGGAPRVDGKVCISSAIDFVDTNGYVVDDCLLFYETQIPENSPHNFTWTSEENGGPLLVNRFEIVEYPKRASESTSGTTSETSFPTGRDAIPGNSDTLGAGPIAGITIGTVTALVLVAVALCIWIKRRRRNGLVILGVDRANSLSRQPPDSQLSASKPVIVPMLSLAQSSQLANQSSYNPYADYPMGPQGAEGGPATTRIAASETTDSLTDFKRLLSEPSGRGSTTVGTAYSPYD